MRAWLSVSVVAMSLVTAAAAHAQTPPPGDGEATPPPAVAAPAVDEDESDAKARARVHFKKGVEAYDAGQYKDAIDAFLEANNLFPNAILSFNAARAYEMLKDSAGALRFYRSYLRQAPDAHDKSEIDKRISDLEQVLSDKGVQQVTVFSEPEGATVILDGRPVGITPWTGEILPGRHRARLVREGFGEGTTEFELLPHRAIDVRVELGPGEAAPGIDEAPGGPAVAPLTPGADAAPTPSGGKVGLPTWIAFGVAGGALGGALVFEGLRSGSESSVHDEPTQIGRREKFDEMEGRQTTARVLFGVGAVAAAVGGVLLYLDLSSASGGDGVEMHGACDGDGCGAALGGRF